MELQQLSDHEFNLFRDLIHQLCGISLGIHKRSLVEARLAKRLRYHNLQSYSDYYGVLVMQRESGPEIPAFINALTTNKTEFFREPHHFEHAAQEVISGMVVQARRGEIPRRLRIWHAGCSTGEEPYSMAITALESLRGETRWDVRLLASDIDTNVLEHAQRGEYAEERVASISDEMLRSWFLRARTPAGTVYKAKPALRDLIAFRRINLLDDAWPIHPDVRFDIVFCRNVIIYFDRQTQMRLVARLASRIRPGGWLYLGHSEALVGLTDLYTPIGGTIFRRTEDEDAVRRAA